MAGMTDQRPISRAAFARHAGVSASAITQASREGGSLHDALVNGRIDANHPAAVAYLEKRGADPAAAQAPQQAKQPAPAKKAAAKKGWGARNEKQKAASQPDPEAGPAELPANIAAFADWTLREIVERFGTDTAFKDLLQAAKTIEDVEDKRLRNAERRGELISRSLVEAHVFGLIEATFKRLLNDSPKTLASQIRSAVEAGSTTEKTEAIARDIITGQLRTIKAQTTKALKQAARDTGEGDGDD